MLVAAVAQVEYGATGLVPAASTQCTVACATALVAMPYALLTTTW
jgi:hypothetical protein